ncbi:unnamed protein product [Ectocarpus sp. 4 AP-2014]
MSTSPPFPALQLAWITDTRETAKLDASRRSRQDAAAAADQEAETVQMELASILDTRHTLNSTQCLGWQTCLSEETCGNHTYEWWADVNGSVASSHRGENASCPCTIVFNTSSLNLEGAISAVGELALTAEGTEVAVWSLNHDNVVYLGPEITVQVTGQRALAILSRGSLVLNTSITAEPSTLGGFPGGGGIARDPGGGADLLLSPPSIPPDFDLSSLVNGTLERVGESRLSSYNVNGPGSASYRYYLFTITTSADDVDDVQRICTSADEGQTLRGCFHVSHGNFFTECIPHDAPPSTVQDIIEAGLNAEPVGGPGPLPFPRSTAGDTGAAADGEPSWVPGVGQVNVSSDGYVDDEGGRCWTVTFSSAIGAVDLMTVSATGDGEAEGNRLTGLGAAVSVETVQVGNAISGTFSVRFRGGGAGEPTHETAQLPVTASAATVSGALLELPGVSFARTTRNLPAEAVAAGCHDGLCRVGPAPGGGLEWIVELGTRVGSAEPSSPTVVVGAWKDDGDGVQEGDFDWPEVDGSNLEGEGAEIRVTKGWGGAQEQLAASFNASQPFSFALGGAGASHGGTGGLGAYQSPASGAPREPYSTYSVPDLVGGSGGARSGLSPAAVNALGFSEGSNSSSRLMRGLGGAGGGAIELLALNDLTIGVIGSVAVDGGDGTADWDNGGGGGSGGSVVIAAGGAVRHAGAISARGGNGGRTLRPLSKNAGGGGAGGRVVLYGQSVDVVGGEGANGEERGTVDVGGGSCFVTTKSGDLRDDACGDGRAGGEGSFKVDAALGYTFGIDDGFGLGGAGAQGTNSSLLLSRHDGTVDSSSGQPFQAFRAYDGPEYGLLRGDGSDDGEETTALTPERVTFYMKVAGAQESSLDNSSGDLHSNNSDSNHASAAEWGAVFALLGPGTNYSSSTSAASFSSYNASDWAEAPVLYNSSGPSSASSSSNTSPTAGSFPAPNTSLVGVSISGGVMRHGAGYRSVPWDPGEEESSAGGGGGVLDDRVEGDRWYKVDIMMRWDANGTAGEYDVLVDGVARAEDQPFGTALSSVRGVERVGLYVLGEGRVWFDEIYLGPDFTMGFRCPESSRRGVETRNAGSLKRWENLVDPGQSENKVMQRHENFLSNTEKYLINHGGLVPFDGDGMREYLVDDYVRDSTDPPLVEGLRAGSLLEMPRGEGFVGKRPLRGGSARSSDGDGLWSSDASSAGRGSGPHKPGGTRYWYGEHEIEETFSSANVEGYWRSSEEFDGWTGGVGACSTDDFVDWRFEGVMLHYANVSDMVLGREPEGGMVLQQPKTLRLETTVASNSTTGNSSSSSNSTGLSESEDTFVMWMGAGESNGTFGLSAVATSGYPDGPFNLRRTLYPDGNETHDQTVFIAGADGRGYLARTYYAEIEYVLPGAVMQPVWSSVEHPDGSVDFGLSYHRAFYSPDYDDYHDIYIQRWRMEDLPWKVTCVNRITGESRDVPYGSFNEDRGYCNQPEEYKVILGQGYPVVSSRFQDPDDRNNSYWSPDSVPSVQAQSWAANYRDGLCGIREMGEDMDEDDPGLDDRTAANRSDCSNIADNPIHETVPDKLVGTRLVVETRLAKYVAVSMLTRDLLDTSAVLTSFEGELESQDDLMALISGSGYDFFDWSAGADIRSTFHPQVFGDYETAPDVLRRFHQYESSENDRARYSLACQLDGTCPVNFRDEITVGHT